MNPQEPEPRRSRDAAATRRAILKAAHDLFLHRSFEQVGMRDIAHAARVNVALIHRYFGSKVELFEKAVMSGASLGGLVEAEGRDLPRLVAEYYLELRQERGRFDQVLALLRSAHHEAVAGVFRDDLQASFVEPLAERIGGEHAGMRAGMAIALLLGLAVMRDVLSTEPLASAGESELLEAMVPMLRVCLEGPQP